MTNILQIKNVVSFEDAETQYKIGKRYDIYNGNEKQNNEIAAKWYRKSAKQGHALAQFYLGCLYLGGRGVPQNDKAAAKWIRKAAEQGEADAQYMLGEFYTCGQGVPQNIKIAIEWLEKAAKQGQEEAERNLLCLTNSCDPESDLEM